MTPEELDQLHQRRLEAFVLRARRVKAHSLYQDLDELVRVGNVTFEIEVTADGASVTQKLPPEEVVESAAARVRPLLLQEEDSYHQNALTALGWMLRGVENEQVRQILIALKKEWAEFDPKGRDSLAYMVQAGHIDEVGPSPTLADNVLAFAWIYGDVVHADTERLTETEQHGVRERYRAAAPLVCRLIQQTVATLHVVQWLMAQNLITLPTEIFERDVIVGDPVFRQNAMAPAGTEMPPVPIAVSEEFGPAWQRLDLTSIGPALQPEPTSTDD